MTLVSSGDFLMSATEVVEKFIGQIPSPDEIRERLTQNIHEGRMLRKLLKIANDRRQSVSGASASQGAPHAS